MALIKTAVFIASRFEEFAELREQLKRKITDYTVVQLTPIDLNDGNVSHRPPMAECLGYVRRSEFMILLLGDTYGSIAPKAEKSYTHLEYEEAIREGSNTRVLVFCIGESYRDRRIRYSDDTGLAAWQRQVEENHTLGFFEPETSLDEIAKGIFERLLAALYEMRFGALSVDNSDGLPDDLFDDLSDESSINDTEVASLEKREAQARGISLVDDRARFSDMLQALTQPTAVAALEQREEAQRAIDIHEYGAAAKHLKRALDLKPLDLMSNYWLAQLYLALGRKEKYPEAIELAERAAHIAEHDGSTIRAAACYLIAARAAQLSDNAKEGLSYARQAVEIAPNFARAYLELARQSVLCGKKSDALDAIRRAYSLYPKSLREVFGDPTFRPIRKSIDSLLQEIKEKIRADVQQLLDREKRIADLAGTGDILSLSETSTVPRLIDTARGSVRRQHEGVCMLVTKAQEAIEALSVPDWSPQATYHSTLPFKFPGSAKIVEWFKQPGEIIQPNEIVCSYHFDRSSSIRTWTWKGSSPMRMVSRAGDNGVLINSDTPNLFECCPIHSQITGPSKVQQLRSELSKAQKIATSAGEDRENLQNHMQKKRLHGISIPGKGQIGAGLILLAASFGMLALGSVIWGIVALVSGAIMVYSGNVKRLYYRADVSQIQLSLDDARREETEARAIVSSIESELGILQSRCEEIQMNAKEALKQFEGFSLSKSPRLLPFPSLYGCREGDAIRLHPEQMSNFKTRSERQIEIIDDLPEWLAPQENSRMKISACLYRVVQSTTEKIVLSRRGAFLGADGR